MYRFHGHPSITMVTFSLLGPCYLIHTIDMDLKMPWRRGHALVTSALLPNVLLAWPQLATTISRSVGSLLPTHAGFSYGGVDRRSVPLFKWVKYLKCMCHARKEGFTCLGTEYQLLITCRLRQNGRPCYKHFDRLNLGFIRSVQALFPPLPLLFSGVFTVRDWC